MMDRVTERGGEKFDAHYLLEREGLLFQEMKGKKRLVANVYELISSLVEKLSSAKEERDDGY